MCKISYEIQEAATVTVKVVDILGITVKLLSNRHDEAGAYEVNIEPEEFPIGKYYYKVFVNNSSAESNNVTADGSLLSSGQFKV